MLAAIEKQKQSAQWQDNGGQFIPHPSTWLNQRRWEDELPKAAPPPAKPVLAQRYDQRTYEKEEETPEEIFSRLNIIPETISSEFTFA